MHLRTDDGADLNAEFSVESNGDGLSLFLESAGGRGTGDGHPRNHEYFSALRLLLLRLQDLNAVLEAALVASARVKAMPERERSLLMSPLKLADVKDIDGLRLAITGAQGKVALPAGAKKPGNNQKRIELRLSVPGYEPGDADRLAVDLAAPKPKSTERAEDLLRSLIGHEIFTATGSSNIVLGVHGDLAYVGTSRSPNGQPVSVRDVQVGLDLLARDGSVPVGVDVLGHRSSFVGAVLAALPDTQVTTDPVTVTLQAPTDDQVADNPHFGELDSRAEVKVRNEQATLRQLLIGNKEVGTCALCGVIYPVELLIAAHIKKRAVCTDDERRDLRRVAMLACSLGCDILYERGWITVDQNGRILAAQTDHAFGDRLQELAGARCTAHSEDSEQYFAWHRSNIFRGDANLVRSLITAVRPSGR